MDAIYARQSIDKKDSVSIETQIAHCKRYAAESVEIFQDKGYSGKNTNRPDFHRLMEAVEAGRITKIIVYRLDRFSRSIADFGQIWDRLEHHRVEFQSVTENFDTSSPMGRAMLNIVLVFAQLERETIAERVRDNYQHRFTLGAWPGGPAPYGFSLTKTTDQNGHRISSLSANEHAETVHQIFQLYSENGTSLRTVAKTLNEQNIPGPKRSAWDSVSLSRILHSPLYTQATEDVYWWYTAKGLQCKQPIEAFDGSCSCNIIGRRDRSKGKYNDLADQFFSLSNHSGFIPTDLWLACQMKLEQNSPIASGTAGKHSWLTGLLKCGNCGYAVKIIRDGAKYYLNCSGRASMGICHQTIRVDLRELEQAVGSQLQSMLSSCPPETILPAEHELTAELRQTEDRIDRLVTALSESSTVSASYISQQIDRLHAQREQILNKMKTEPSKSAVPRQLNFETASTEEKRIIAHEFIDRILLKDDQVDILWKV